MHTKAPKPCALRSFFVDDSCCRSRYGVSCLTFVCVLRKYICRANVTRNHAVERMLCEPISSGCIPCANTCRVNILREHVACEHVSCKHMSQAIQRHASIILLPKERSSSGRRQNMLYPIKLQIPTEYR